MAKHNKGISLGTACANQNNLAQKVVRTQKRV